MPQAPMTTEIVFGKYVIDSWRRKNGRIPPYLRASMRLLGDKYGRFVVESKIDLPVICDPAATIVYEPFPGVSSKLPTGIRWSK